MEKTIDSKASGPIDMVVFPYGQMEKFSEFKKQYGTMSERQVYREILRVKNEVSEEVLAQHIKNLDALGNMEGFFNDTQKEKMDKVKSLLKLQVPSRRAKGTVETAFVSGSSLLLWFLLLVAIW